jgi:hypothetical protein
MRMEENTVIAKPFLVTIRDFLSPPPIGRVGFKRVWERCFGGYSGRWTFLSYTPENAREESLFTFDEWGCFWDGRLEEWIPITEGEESSHEMDSMFDNEVEKRDYDFLNYVYSALVGVYRLESIRVDS